MAIGLDDPTPSLPYRNKPHQNKARTDKAASWMGSQLGAFKSGINVFARVRALDEWVSSRRRDDSCAGAVIRTHPFCLQSHHFSRACGSLADTEHFWWCFVLTEDIHKGGFCFKQRPS